MDKNCLNFFTMTTTFFSKKKNNKWRLFFVFSFKFDQFQFFQEKNPKMSSALPPEKINQIKQIIHDKYNEVTKKPH